MKKKLVLLMIALTILSGVIVNARQPVNYAFENDGEIEWNAYGNESVM